MSRKIDITAILVWLIALRVSAQVEPILSYKAMQDPHCEAWVDSVVSRMDIREKVGQLLVYTITPDQSRANVAHLKEVINTYHVGGLLFSGGQLQDHVALTNLAQETAQVPLMITFDGEWGLNMRIKSIPAFPRNAILGCIRDEQLMYEYGKEVARQLREIGVHVNFAPVADVNINPRNPVINTRSFGEDPYNVADKVIAYSTGLESGGVLSVSKHFPGHGDTDVDSHKALPVLPFTRERLDSVELYPFRQAIGAGLGGIMVGHLQVDALDPGKRLPSSLSPNVVTGLLKEELDFRGLIFTDALSMSGVGTPGRLSVEALKAGNEVLLVPHPFKREYDNLLDAIKKGEISEAEIDRRCRKVLRYKYALGVDRQQPVQLSGLVQRLHTPQTESLLLNLKKAALTVVNNNEGVLPLYAEEKNIALLSVGDGNQDAAFVKELNKYAYVAHYKLTSATSGTQQAQLLKELRKHTRIIISIAGTGIKGHSAFLNNFEPEDHLVYAFFTPHKTMLDLEVPLAKADAIVLAHANETAVQQHAAAVLFGRKIANGRLSESLGRLFPAGAGVDITPSLRPTYEPADFGMDEEVLREIDQIATGAIKAGAMPGCQIVVLKEGKPVYDRCFGKFTYEGDREVLPTDLYDVASLTKTSATLLAVMKLYDKGMLNVTDLASKYLPYLKGTDKRSITLRDLLFHQSGLPATLPFWRELVDTETIKGTLFSRQRDAIHTIQTGPNTYISSVFDFKKEWVSGEPSEQYNLRMGDRLWINGAFRGEMMEEVIRTPLRQRKYVYSCVGFILLQQVVEAITGMPLDRFLSEEFYTPMQLERTAYLPLRHFEKEEVAPTVKTDYLRREMLQGYVHDEAAACQGGISGNAGLFSTARDVAMIHQMILNGGELDGKRYLSEETCRYFTTTKSGISHRVLGYNRPLKGSQHNPCSPSAPASVYGHTGFTGTCAWVDPENEMVFVFLSNRVYPNSWNNKLSSLDVRRKIQETLYRSLRR